MTQQSHSRVYIWRKLLTWKDTCTPEFIVAQFIKPKTWKQLKCPPTDEWLKKMFYICMYIHTHTIEYYSAIKKNEIMPFAGIWMDLRDYHTKWSKSDRARQIACDITYMWNLKYDKKINLFTKPKNRFKDIENKFVVTKWEWEWGQIN